VVECLSVDVRHRIPRALSVTERAPRRPPPGPPDAVYDRIMFIRSVLGHMPPEADLVALYVRATDDDSVRLAVHPTPLLPLTHAKALVNLANRGLLDQDPYWALPLLDRFLGP
jgi:hypothetical protein